MLFNPYALILIISAFISASLAVYVWQRRASIPSGTLFTLMMLAITTWSLAYGLELASSDFMTMRFWLSVEYFGIATAPVFWLLFTIRYTGGTDWLDDWRVALLFIVPALTIILNLTNELHYFYYTSIELDTSGPFPLLALERGPWYWFNVIYSYLAMILGTLILVRFWHQTPRPYRRQTTVLILAAVIPLGLNFLYLLGFRPFAHLDLSPVAFTATGVLMALGIARLSLLR
ncbi:MAG: PAS domain-containing sensor histidine kinase, partial [Chloroflexia bacterium]|nr:PAS domain-containing sensor histidine kinase [Chloroflexia bacterium]